MENMMIPCFARRDGPLELIASSMAMGQRDIYDMPAQMLVNTNISDKRHIHLPSLSLGAQRRPEF